MEKMLAAYLAELKKSHCCPPRRNVPCGLQKRLAMKRRTAAS